MPNAIWFISKLFGIYYLSLGWAVYSSCLSLIMSALNVYCVSIIERYVTFSSALNLVTEVVYRWLNSAYLIVITAEGIFYRKRFMLTRNSLKQIKINTSTIIMKGIVGPMLIWGIELSTTNYRRFFDVANTLTLFLPMTMIRLVILQYIILSKQLERAFRKNKLNIKFTVESINKSIQEYDNLCNISDNIVNIFSTKLLLSMTITFIQSVVYALLFIRRCATLMYTPLRFSFFWFKVLYLVPVISMFLVILQEGLIIVSASSSLKFEADDYLRTIDKLVIEDVHGNLAKNKMIRLIATYRRQVNITVYGLFTIDNALLYAMVQSALTYLIILVQFVMSFQCDIV